MDLNTGFNQSPQNSPIRSNLFDSPLANLLNNCLKRNMTSMIESEKKEDQQLEQM